MPELPEVMRIGESLNRHLASKRLLGITITHKSRYHTNPFKQIEYLTKGLLLLQVITKAKRILFQFYNEVTNHHITLVSFLGMEGHWLQQEGKHSGVIFQFGRIETYNGTIFNITDKVFYYDDTRHMGTFSVCINEADMLHVFKNVGPDFMSGQITFDLYHLTIKSKRTLHKQICWWMMEQKYFSGIGNYLKAEILYACKISPHRILSSMTDEDIKSLYYYSIFIIRESYLAYGLTIATYADPDGNVGRYPRKAYQQPMDPNGYLIIKETLTDNRTTHWCPQVQK